MKKEHNYKNERVKKLYKDRATIIHNAIPSGLELDEENKVWKVSTMLPIDKENAVLIDILFFEEVIGFEATLKLPDSLNNDIFKHRVKELGKVFSVLDQCDARLILGEMNDNSFLILQIAYMFTEDGKYDSYNANVLSDILVYISDNLTGNLQDYTNKITEAYNN